MVDDEHSFVGEGEVRVGVVGMGQFRAKRHRSSSLRAVSMMKPSDVLCEYILTLVPFNCHGKVQALSQFFIMNLFG